MGRAEGTSNTSWRAAALLLVAVSAVALWSPDASATGADDGGSPATEAGVVTVDGGEYGYLLHTPASYDPARPAPLVVVVHGCQTTADQQMRSSRFNEVGQREGFVVLYADVDGLGRALPGPANQCWRFPFPPAWTRDRSDAGAIAAMTRTAMADRVIDPERVYIVGMSAGGLMAAVQAAAHPDLYAAAGIIAASGYADWPCLGTGTGIPVELSALLAHQAMGSHARVVPRLVMGGTADVSFPPACVTKALQQGLRTNNLVLSGAQTAPISLEPAAVRDERVPGGHRSVVSSFVDPDGCLVGEQWIIEGLAHSWPGGTTVQADRYNNDTRAPSAAEVSWSFFQRYRRSDTAMPCATLQAVGPSPAERSAPTPAGTSGPSPSPGPADDAPPARSSQRAATGGETLPATGHSNRLGVALLLAALGLLARHWRNFSRDTGVRSAAPFPSTWSPRCDRPGSP